ncbi:glycosyltransferase family 2 protein [Candidatus Parcubacteria bacterium]|nr:MAG: glycosyltransferase family 2 protein [Candidatus Parcubacteria bacterium]
MKRPNLSVYILAYNEADKIRDAIESVRGWADEILVADSHSTDGTATVAKKLGARVVQIPFQTFGQLRNKAIAACNHEWIFSLDADERMTEEAKREIDEVLRLPAADLYFVPRRNFFFGRWIRHCGWYPDYRQPQLFRKGTLTFSEADEVHEGWKAKGEIGYLRHAIIQIPFSGLNQLQQKACRYSDLGARKLLREGQPVGMWRALAHGIWAFVRIYILKLGILDGWAGFIIALGNFEGTFYRYAKAVERRDGLNKFNSRFSADE